MTFLQTNVGYVGPVKDNEGEMNLEKIMLMNSYIMIVF